MRSVSTSSWQKDARCTTEQVKNLLHSLLWWIINQSCFSFSVLMQKKPKSYSATLMDQIPIKYLICQAQGLHQELGGKMRIYSCTVCEYVAMCFHIWSK